MKVMFLSLLLLPAIALADDAALLRCRALHDVPARVQCYDAIPLGAPAIAAAPAKPDPHEAERNFGLPAAPVFAPAPKADAAPQSISSTIVGTFDGWQANTRFKLANGQVWRVIDGSDATLSVKKDVPVKIVRNFFGTMFMEIEGSNLSPKVRRVE